WWVVLRVIGGDRLRNDLPPRSPPWAARWSRDARAVRNAPVHLLGRQVAHKIAERYPVAAWIADKRLIPAANRKRVPRTVASTRIQIHKRRSDGSRRVNATDLLNRHRRRAIQSLDVQPIVCTDRRTTVVVT